jgi:AcrR family transcriptional regulator
MRKQKRARTAGDKQQRKDQILQAAQRLVDQSGYVALTMDSLARCCKLSKGTIYIYFKTREEVLLAILQQDFAAWFVGMRKYLRQSPQPFGPTFPKAWMYSLENQPRLIGGMAFLHLTLEPNISNQFAVEWKTFLLEEVRGLHYEILNRFEPRVSLPSLVKFLSLFTAISVGIWMQAQTSPQVAFAYEARPELKIFSSSFEENFLPAAQALLNAEQFLSLRALRVA